MYGTVPFVIHLLVFASSCLPLRLDAEDRVNVVRDEPERTQAAERCPLALDVLPGHAPAMRRPRTYIARSFTETLVLSRDDLSALFMRNRRSAARIAARLLREANRQQRLQYLMNKFVIGSLPQQSGHAHR